MHSVLEIIRRTTGFLSDKGVESPRLDAELLVGHALGVGRMQLYLQFERPLTEGELEAIRPLVRRRGQREPLQHILGEVEWAGLKLRVDRRALIPRPETEYLVVELLPARIAGSPARALDLGTGSGAIALALAAAHPGLAVTAVDASGDALALAGENARRLGLESRVTFLRSDWFAALPAGERFDLIVANPPYLAAHETAAAEPEVREYEPASALSADEEGLADLRRIALAAPAYLIEGGLLAMETGIAHHERLLKLLAGAGFARTESAPDLTGRDRFVFAWR